jgi:hypothetical protein
MEHSALCAAAADRERETTVYMPANAQLHDTLGRTFAPDCERWTERGAFFARAHAETSGYGVARALAYVWPVPMTAILAKLVLQLGKVIFCGSALVASDRSEREVDRLEREVGCSWLLVPLRATSALSYRVRPV